MTFLCEDVDDHFGDLPLAIAGEVSRDAWIGSEELRLRFKEQFVLSARRQAGKDSLFALFDLHFAEQTQAVIPDAGARDLWARVSPFPLGRKTWRLRNALLTADYAIGGLVQSTRSYRRLFPICCPRCVPRTGGLHPKIGYGQGPCRLCPNRVCLPQKSTVVPKSRDGRIRSLK